MNFKTNIMKKAILFLSIFIFFTACEKPSTAPPKSTNSEYAQKQPYVVLVSIDGFRYDYIDKYDLPNLTKIAAANREKMLDS